MLKFFFAFIAFVCLFVEASSNSKRNSACISGKLDTVPVRITTFSYPPYYIDSVLQNRFWDDIAFRDSSWTEYKKLLRCELFFHDSTFTLTTPSDGSHGVFHATASGQILFLEKDHDELDEYSSFIAYADIEKILFSEPLFSYSKDTVMLSSAKGELRLTHK